MMRGPKNRSISRAALEQISRGGGGEAERAHQMQTLQAIVHARLKTCEDETTMLTKLCSDEKTKLVADAQRREAQLISERDEQRKSSEARLMEGDRCRTELAACEQRLAAQPERTATPSKAVPAASAIPAARPAESSAPSGTNSPSE